MQIKNILNNFGLIKCAIPMKFFVVCVQTVINSESNIIKDNIIPNYSISFSTKIFVKSSFNREYTQIFRKRNTEIEESHEYE